MELRLLRSLSISYHCPKESTFRHRKSKFSVGIPTKSSIITGNNISPLTISCKNASDAETAVVVDKPPPIPRRFEVLSGHPAPFGATAREGGVNFAIFSGNATSASLCLISLFDLPEKRVTHAIPLNPLMNRTGDIWHVFLKGDFKEMAVVSRGVYGALGPDGGCWPQMAGVVPFSNDEFDWEGDLPLNIPQEDLVIYEMHVRGFTRHKSSNSEFLGTYLGVVEKLDYLMKLGINCIELMPCHEFNELEYYSYNSVLGDYKMNFWGYSTINFFSPMARYSSSGIDNYGLGAVNEFKHLVREAHKRGIEVIMDVVFNHTVEGNENGPILLSFRGLDNRVFYMIAPKEGEFVSISVKKLRRRQMRNFFLCLMVSQGVPMIYMGDEYGHTKGGNNNTYCHDNFMNYFRWDKMEESLSDYFRFCRLMTKFRRECESLGLNDFPTAERLQWHGHTPGTPDWSDTSRFVAFTLMDSVRGELYIAFNASHVSVTIALPERPGYKWEPVVDTGKPAPFDFLSDDLPDREIAIRHSMRIFLMAICTRCLAILQLFYYSLLMNPVSYSSQEA